MGDTDINSATTTAMNNAIKDFTIDGQQIDGANIGENTWDNENFSEYLGYYKEIPELKTAINAFATWVLGKGWTTSKKNKAILESITGWGEDTFNSILWNLLVTKKFNGDAYAQVVRNNDGRIMNIKPLDPSNMRTVVNDKGIIVRYEQRNRAKEIKKFKPEEILHLVNDRIADEIHGTGVIESVKWVIDARNESMNDWRRILHRSTIRIIEVDADNATKLTSLKNQYKDAIKNGEVLIVPKDNVSFPDSPLNYIDPQQWIKYLEDFFYQALGVPKVILGGSSEFTEASAKISYLTYEQVYTREVTDLEADLWNQLAIRIEFNKPVSLKNETLSSEEKNTGQVGFQQNDTNIDKGKGAIENAPPT